jgi:hypothetical protein
MSLPAVLERVALLNSVLAPPAPVATPAQATQATGFVGALQQAGLAQGTAAAIPAATAAPATTGAALTGASPAGASIVALVQQEVGVAEQPPGSNNSPRIAQYRQATVGSGVGPWCAYFTSWAAREVGVPLGDQGQGFGRVDDVYAWAQRAGKAIPAGSGQPQPGDLIVWDEHIGIVESVLPDGRIQTIEGNSSDRVSRRVHDASGNGAIGYVRLG